MIRVACLCIPLFLFVEYKTYAQQQPEWTGEDRLGRTRPGSDLEELLRTHRQWLKSGQKSGTQADLSGAQMYNAPLAGADLSFTKLRGASLGFADLTGADLREADLSEAHLSYAELTGAIFEPKSLPEPRGISRARNLEFLTYQENPDSLFQLRKQFQDGGFREQERKITYALKRREAELSCEKCTSRKPGSEDQTRAILW